MVDIAAGARGPTAPSLVVEACVGISEIVPIPNREIAEKHASNRTWDNQKNQKNATSRIVVRRNEFIFFL